MNLVLPNYSFHDAWIPVLWGDRAIVEERSGTLSVIAIENFFPSLEIVRDQPAPGVNFSIIWGGFQIMRFPNVIYQFNVREKLFTSQTLGLPEVQIAQSYVRVGAEIYPNFSNFDGLVGVQVTPNGVQVGALLPMPLMGLVERRAGVS
jgi:hypothetical protein